jgi:hypothetical protein
MSRSTSTFTGDHPTASLNIKQSKVFGEDLSSPSREPGQQTASFETHRQSTALKNWMWPSLTISGVVGLNMMIGVCLPQKGYHLLTIML